MNIEPSIGQMTTKFCIQRGEKIFDVDVVVTSCVGDATEEIREVAEEIVEFMLEKFSTKKNLSAAKSTNNTP